GSSAAILVEAGAQGPARQGLVRFDTLFGSGSGQIPIGSTITSASLTVWVGQGASTLATIELHRMLAAWNPATATWNAFSTSGTPGLQTDGVEALAVADGSVGGVTGTGYRIIGGLGPVLQAWAAGAANNGWVVTAPGSTTGWTVDSSEGVTPTHRPLLTVQF